MQNTNNANVVGRLVTDAVLKNLNQSSLIEFTICFNNSRKNGGQWEDEANFIDCKYWGNAAKAISNILKKGTKVCVSAKLKQEKWSDKDSGAKRSRHILMCNFVELCESKNENSQQRQMENDIKTVFFQNNNDDIPF